MITKAFVLMALLAAPTFASPIPRDETFKREPLKLPKLGGGASSILGPAIQGVLGAAGTLGAQGLENANQQDIANQQIAAAQAAAAPSKREPLKLPKLGGGGGEILGSAIQGILGAAGTLGAQGLQNANQQDIANQQIAAAQAAAAPSKREPQRLPVGPLLDALQGIIGEVSDQGGDDQPKTTILLPGPIATAISKREPLKLPKLGGAGSEILGSAIQGVLGAAGTLGAQGLQNANQQDIANQQIAAAQAAAAPSKREPLKLPKLGGAGSEILGGAIQGVLGAAGALGAQGLQNANQQDIANQQIAAAQAAAAPSKREPLKLPKLGGAGSEILGSAIQGVLGAAGTLGAQGLQNANQQDIANQQIAAAQAAAAPSKREPLKLPKLGGAGSEILGSAIQGVLGAAGALGAQGLQNANQQDIANQQIAAAQAAAAPSKREPLKLPKLGGAGSEILGSAIQGVLGAAGTLGAQGLQNANQQNIANQQIAAAQAAAAPSKREPLKLPKLGGAGSEILGSAIQGVLGAAGTLGAQGLQNANQQDIANQQIAAAQAAAAPSKREPLKLPKIGSGASDILGGAIQGILGAAGTLGAQGLENANQQDIANQQIAAAQAAAAPSKRYVIYELD